jgi:CheY-like chemotaxis protein
VISVNGKGIKGILDQHKPDLVLLDLHMQGVDGENICKEIKSDPLTTSIPVLLFSANANIETIKEDCGADGFITKPLNAHLLKQAIESYLPRLEESERKQ